MTATTTGVDVTFFQANGARMFLMPHRSDHFGSLVGGAATALGLAFGLAAFGLGEGGIARTLKFGVTKCTLALSSSFFANGASIRLLIGSTIMNAPFS